MTPSEYQELCKRTQASVTEASNRMAFHGHTAIPLTQAGAGIVKEGGEILDHIEKWIYFGNPYDKEAISKEIGDVLWYVALACNTIGVNMEDVMEANVEKLRKRYNLPEKV